MEINEEQLTIVNVHVVGSKPEVTEMYATIGKEIAKNDCEKVIWCGDFNAIMEERDRTGAGLSGLDKLLKYQVESWEMTDIWRAMHPNVWRFTHFVKCHKSLSRLDMIFGSPSLMSNVLHSDIGISYQSDHSPVLLDFSLDENSRGPGYWKILAHLINNNEFKSRIVDLIKDIEKKTNAGTKPSLLWDTIQAGIRGVAIKFASELKRKRKSGIEELEQQIAESVTSRDSTTLPDQRARYDDKIKYLQIELDQVYETIHMHSKEYNMGRKYYYNERSLRYFLREKICKKNQIKCLQVEHGVTVSTDTDILAEAHRFYSRLYCKPSSMDAGNPGLLHKFLKQVPGDRMSIHHFRSLDQPLTLQELYTALKQMKKDTSPGLSGLTVEFFIEFWPIVGRLVFESLQDAWDQGRLSISQQREVIKLIPKEGKDPLNVQNWRPITFLNMDHKMLTKALSLRLASVLPDLIHSDQKGFVCGRFSGENVLDVYAMISAAEADHQQYALLMLDIEKAFDSVSWSYLEEVLTAFNFPQLFITWIHILHNGKELHLMNNGHMSQPIFPTRSSSQGCSLSPQLYVLVMETLALAIRKNDKILGFQIGDFQKK